MTAAALIEAYLAGAEALAEAIRGLGPAALRARPVAGTWSTLEVVCHLADAEALFADRMKRVLAEDRPTLLFADPERFAAALAFDARDAVEEVACVGAIRRQMARILRAQPPDAWQRVGVHSKEGERTLEQLVRKAIDHLEHHLTFVRAKRQALDDGAASQPAGGTPSVLRGRDEP
ncbi:MAG: DinB family protein [Planctomycetia bacterium]|nr:DinB family protein [Planctomycetia bacterium]